jgi:hypothetical protein
MNRRLFLVLGLYLSVLMPVYASGSFYCGSRIISEGDSSEKLIAICGDPAYRDVWSPYALAAGAIAEGEEWYYNFGSGQLLRIVRLRGGKIEAIDEDGYGYAETPEGHCDGSSITPGMSKFRLLLACGEPLTRRLVSTYAPYNGRYNDRFRNSVYFEAVFREEWVYNFGTSRFMRAVTLENGRVADVRQTDRGFNE